MKKYGLFLWGMAAFYSVFFGVCLGEEFLDTRLQMTLMAAGFIGLFPAAWRFGWPKGGLLWGFTLGLPLLLLAAWFASGWDLRAALDDCWRNADHLRSDLTQYRIRHGGLPGNLEQLDWPKLPGNRLIGSGVLHYEAGVNRYRLYFSSRPRQDRWNSCSIPQTK